MLRYLLNLRCRVVEAMSSCENFRKTEKQIGGTLMNAITIHLNHGWGQLLIGRYMAFVTLLIGALIEARSCERFASLVPLLPDRLSRFYGGLLASEARHFMHYLHFAEAECGISPATLERLHTAHTVWVSISDRVIINQLPRL